MNISENDYDETMRRLLDSPEPNEKLKSLIREYESIHVIYPTDIDQTIQLCDY